MDIKLEPFSLQISSHGNFTTIHNADTNIDVYSVTNGECNKRNGELNLGNWSSLSLGSGNKILYDNDVSHLHSDTIENLLTVLIWKDGLSHRIAVTPDEHPIYDPSSVHRLYWATDTRILYQNIADTWQMIGTLKHDLLDDSGKYSHMDIDTKLDELNDTIGSLQGGNFDIVEW